MRMNGIGFGPKKLFFCAEQIRAKLYHFKRREHQEYQKISFPEFQKLVQNRHLKKMYIQCILINAIPFSNT